MKTTKRILAMALAIMMVMALATTAFAAEGDTYTLTLNNAQAGHTYSAYQIFAGDLSDGKLSNIVWGDGVTEAAKTDLGDAATKAAALKNSDQASAFAAEVAPYLATVAGSVTIAEGETSGTISGLEAGYYLVQTTGTTAENGVYTYYIMKVVKNTTANIKADAPEVKKEVNKTDLSIGDTVTFTLTATMPSTFDGYESYQVVFHDTMFKGLTYNNDAKASVEGFTVTTGTDGDNTTITVTNNDVLDHGVKAGDTITVTYTATLNADAIIGTEGNFNKVYLEYSNNPNGTGTGNTPPAEVKVYTWSLKVTKVDGDGNALAGAGFTLYDADENAIKLTRVGETNVYKVDPNSTTTEITTGDDGILVIEGLESATYTLKETTTPAGYNTAPDTEVTINGSSATPVAEVTVTNYAGSTLPETGGIGTTMFYVIGAILMVGAAVLLVTKRRMSVAE